MRRTTLGIALLLLAGCSPATSGPPAAQGIATSARVEKDAHAELRAIFDAEWEREMRENPQWASRLGDERYASEWGDASLAGIGRRDAHDRELLAKLRAFPKDALGPADRLDYDLFVKLREDAIERHGLGLDLLPLDHMDGVHTANELADEIAFDTPKDFEDWNLRLSKMGAYVDQTIQVMREGIARKIVHPRVIMERAPAQLDAHIVTKPEDSPFYKPFLKIPASIPAAEGARLSRAAKERIAQDVVPAFKRFKAFFVGEYLPAAPADVGISRIPRGAEAYAYLARHHTTTPLGPRKIHEIGLAEVARLRAEMTELMQLVDFGGTLPEFFGFLRRDARFFKKTPDELFQAYVGAAKKIEPLLVKDFGTLPRTPFGVEPIPMAVAPYQTTAFYRPPAADGSRAGTYMVNLYKPEARPTWEIMALTMHESVPGHHLQIALAMENHDIPQFRRHTYWTAYVEGWALYAESLGDEMGLYEDPYAKFGQLAYQMWRAVRLVVDTGMHAMAWDRKRAIDYFLENAPRTELDVTNEIDRYIAWPGQALAYKIGELTIKDLRTRATRELGASFDVRRFHDAVLAGGPRPLDVLERDMAAWITERRSRPR
jgi:uncharacterized protein (DUF885 family)